ncbi:MAG: PP2C family protein-serine/threonine phosphatase [Paracoccaceae bacterium]
MTGQSGETAKPWPGRPGAGMSDIGQGPARRVLIVEDSRTQRRLLRARLERWGFEVVEAEDGITALALLRNHPIPLVISDWMMPGLSGPDLCRAVRTDAQAAAEPASYVYFLLLTAKSEQEDVALGLAAGADDFLKKPVDEGELLARLDAGLRVLDMQARLVEQTIRISRAFAELNGLYETLDRDLRAASLLQRECLPPPLGTCNGGAIAVAYEPAGHVGGDLVGYFPLGAETVGLFSLDVSGHGVASSLLTVRLAQLLGETDPTHHIGFRTTPRGAAPRDPAEVIADLNDRFQGPESSDLYFTIAYAVLDVETGSGRLCLGGHAHPALIAQSGIRFLGNAGPPVGMFPDSRFTSSAFRLGRGERLLLYSDGLTEAEDATGAEIGADRLAEALANEDAAVAVPSVALTSTIERIRSATGRTRFLDDVSALMFERPASADTVGLRARG